MKKKIAFMSVFLIMSDLITKLLVDFNLNLMETEPVIMNFLSITKVYNTGASWNILSEIRGGRIILIIITILVLISLLFYQKNFKLNNRNALAFSLLYSGIVGNLIDRIFYGYVIDFLDFNIMNYDFPVFNLADICIVIGIFLIAIAIFKKEDECGNISE